MLSGRALCDELITRPDESYRLCRVVECDLETSWMRKPCCVKKNANNDAVLCSHVSSSDTCPESLYVLPSIQITFFWHPVLHFMAELLVRSCFLIENLCASLSPPFTFGLYICPLFICQYFLVTSPAFGRTSFYFPTSLVSLFSAYCNTKCHAYRHQCTKL